MSSTASIYCSNLPNRSRFHWIINIVFRVLTSWPWNGGDTDPSPQQDLIAVTGLQLKINDSNLRHLREIAGGAFMGRVMRHGISATRWQTWSPFYKHGLTLITAWISNHMSSKVWEEITHPFPNFNGATVEVWEWLSNFIPNFTMDIITYPCYD